MSNDSDSLDDDRLYHFRKIHLQQRSENDAKKRQGYEGESLSRRVWQAVEGWLYRQESNLLSCTFQEALPDASFLIWKDS